MRPGLCQAEAEKQGESHTSLASLSFISVAIGANLRYAGARALCPNKHPRAWKAGQCGRVPFSPPRWGFFYAVHAYEGQGSLDGGDRRQDRYSRSWTSFYPLHIPIIEKSLRWSCGPRAEVTLRDHERETEKESRRDEGPTSDRNSRLFARTYTNRTQGVFRSPELSSGKRAAELIWSCTALNRNIPYTRYKQSPKDIETCCSRCARQVQKTGCPLTTF